jgi:hypothetical protein
MRFSIKNIFILFFIIILNAYTVAAEGDVLEIPGAEADSSTDSGLQDNEKDSASSDQNESSADSESSDVDGFHVLPAVPRLVVSGKYPFVLGSVPKFFYGQMEDGGIKDYTAVNGAVDIHIMYPFLDHLIVSGGLTFGSSNIFTEDYKTSELFTFMQIRMGLGGALRFTEWLQFGGGLEFGYCHMAPGGFYNQNELTNPNDTVDRTIMGASFNPYVNLDFLITETVILSFKFDYQYGIIPSKNTLESGEVESFHFPALSFGLGFAL